MGMINRIPQGFLRMLGSQTLGENPSQTSSIVQPSIEMTPFYHADSMSVEQRSNTPTGLGQQTQILVPLDEAWMLYGIAYAQTVIVATDTVITNISVAALPNNKVITGNMPIWSSGTLVATNLATPQQMTVEKFFPVPIPLQSGATLAWRVEFQNVFRFGTISLLIARLSG